MVLRNGKTLSHKADHLPYLFAKVVSLMGWNSSYRYKLLGKLIRSDNELLFVFDLTTPEIFVREEKEDGKIKSVPHAKLSGRMAEPVRCACRGTPEQFTGQHV